MQQRRTGREWSVMGAVVCASLVGACQSNTAGTPKAPSADVWAVVDGRDIRREEVERAYRGVVQQTPTPPSEEEVLTMKLGIVDELITQSVLQARGRTLNIEVTDAEVETAFGERKKSVTDEAFQQQLTQRGLTADDMKAGVRRELFVKKVLDKEVSSKIAITDQDITDFYNNNRAQFNVAEPQFRIAQIVITPVPEQQLRNRMNDDAKSPAEAARKAQMLGERLRAGADFSQVAMDYSEDPQSAPQGGDLGFVPMSALNQVPPALRDAVLKSQPGNINTVSSGGAHTIVMLLGREAAGQRDLSAPNVRDGIRDILRDRKEQLLRAAYISSARNDAKVVNHLAQLVVSAQGKLPTLGPVAPGK